MPIESMTHDELKDHAKWLTETKDKEIVASRNLVVQLGTMGRRLTVSNSLNGLLLAALDAKRFHGIEWTELRTYREPGNALLDKTSYVSETEAYQKLVHWIERMNADLKAAVKRKGIREVKKPS